jgi:TRAP-type mannitol/chloroaromatic compound transport system permease small subunit
VGQTIQEISAYLLYGLGGLAAAVGVLACFIALMAVLSPIIRPLRTAASAGRGLIRRAESAGRGFGEGIAWLALIMVLVQFAIVLLRYVFSINSVAVQESVTYMHAAIFMLAAGYTLLEDGHVRVDIFYRGMGPRAQALVNLAGAFLFLLPFAALILWWSLPYVEASWTTLEGSPQPGGLPLVFLLKTIIPAFGVLMILHGGLMAARAAFALTGLTGEAHDGAH